MGPVDDLMWALPDGTRRLLAPTPEAGRFVSAVYGFDETVWSRRCGCGCGSAACPCTRRNSGWSCTW